MPAVMRLSDVIVGSSGRTDCFSWYSQSYSLMQQAGRSQSVSVLLENLNLIKLYYTQHKNSKST